MWQSSEPQSFLMSLVWEQRVVSAEHQSLTLITPIILALLVRLFQYVRSSMYFPYNKFTSQSFEEASLQPTDLKLILTSSFSTRNNSLHICHCTGQFFQSVFWQDLQIVSQISLRMCSYSLWVVSLLSFPLSQVGDIFSHLSHSLFCCFYLKQ